MRAAILLISGAIVVWVLLAFCPIKIVLFGCRITFDYGVRRQCGGLTLALALAAIGYGWTPRLLPFLLLVTGLFLLAELLFQCHEEERYGSSSDRSKPSAEKGGEAASSRGCWSPNLFHLTLQILLIADFILQCLLLSR